MDCNNFFVSCERLFRPDLENKPVAVLSSNDGCIVARSNEVKALGIPMGIPHFKVKDLVKEHRVTLFSSNFPLYRDLSMRVMDVLSSCIPDIAQYSVDEAFFLTQNTVSEEDMQNLRHEIHTKVGIPVSIGVSATKTLAKIASEHAKRGTGVTLLSMDAWKEYASHVKCGQIWGVGRSTVSKLEQMGISDAGTLRGIERTVLQHQFGIMGVRLSLELSGTPVYRVGESAEPLSRQIMSTRSLPQKTHSLSVIESALTYHVEHVSKKLRSLKLRASRLSVIARPSRHSDFSLRKGSAEVVLPLPSSSTSTLLKEARGALKTFYDREVPYSTAGVVVGGFIEGKHVTGSLFDEQHDDGSDAIDTTVDCLNTQFGSGTIYRALQNDSLHWRAKTALRSPSYTTSWTDIPSIQAL